MGLGLVDDAVGGVIREEVVQLLSIRLKQPLQALYYQQLTYCIACTAKRVLYLAKPSSDCSHVRKIGKVTSHHARPLALYSPMTIIG